MVTETCLECLERNTKRLTQYPPCVNQNVRAVYLIWDDTDPVASELARKIDKMRSEYSRDDELKNQLIQMVDASAENANGMLEKAVCQYKNEVRNCVLKDGTAFFLKVNNADIASDVLTRGICERIHVIGTQAKEEKEAANDLSYDWEVKQEQAGAVWYLLLDAAFNERTLSSMYGANSRKTIMGWRDYSLARDEMLDYAVQLLDRQLQTTGKQIEEIYRDWRIEQLVGYMWSEKCVKPEWLPVVGYEALREKIVPRGGIGGRLKKVISTVLHTDAERDIDIRMEDALRIFFGMVGTRSKPEWLRDAVSANLVKRLCQESITDNLINGLRSIFSVVDLSGEVSVILTQKAQSIDGKIQEAKDKLECLLDAPYTLKNNKGSIDELMDGFQLYFTQWETYMKLCLEAGCLGEATKKLGGIRMQCNAIVNQLRTERSRLETQRIKGWSSAALEGKSRMVVNIKSIEDLNKVLDEFATSSCYESMDPKTLQETMANQYAGKVFATGSSHFHLFASNKLCEHDADDFLSGWKLHRHSVSYLPENLFLELLVWEQ